MKMADNKYLQRALVKVAKKFPVVDEPKEKPTLDDVEENSDSDVADKLRKYDKAFDEMPRQKSVSEVVNERGKISHRVSSRKGRGDAMSDAVKEMQETVQEPDAKYSVDQ